MSLREAYRDLVRLHARLCERFDLAQLGLQFGITVEEVRWVTRAAVSEPPPILPLLNFKIPDTMMRQCRARLRNGYLDVYDELAEAYDLGCHQAALWMLQVAKLNLKWPELEVASAEPWRVQRARAEALVAQHGLSWNRADNRYLPNRATVEAAQALDEKTGRTTPEETLASIGFSPEANRHHLPPAEIAARLARVKEGGEQTRVFHDLTDAITDEIHEQIMSDTDMRRAFEEESAIAAFSHQIAMLLQEPPLTADESEYWQLWAAALDQELEARAAYRR